MDVERAPIEPTESLYLVALLPPSNIGRVVGELQAELFRRHRLISALGLGVFLPLAFSQSPPPQPHRGLRGSADLLTQAGSLKTGGIVMAPTPNRGSAAETGKALYVDVVGGGSLEEATAEGAPRSVPWLDELRASFPAGRGLFPLHSGLFLADLTELTARAAAGEATKPKGGAGEPGELPAPGLAVELSALPPPPPLSWAISELVCFALRFGQASSWWSLLEYETIWSVRLRRARSHD